MTDADNPLPTNVRQNVANLGLFVMNHTVTVLTDPRPEQLGSLININRELAAGLLRAPDRRPLITKTAAGRGLFYCEQGQARLIYPDTGDR